MNELTSYYYYRAQTKAGAVIEGTGVKADRYGLSLFSAGRWHRIEPGTLGRCTGVKDSKGALVYEGDRVRMLEGSTEVLGRIRYGKHRDNYLKKLTVGFYVEVDPLQRRVFFWRDCALAWLDPASLEVIPDRGGRT